MGFAEAVITKGGAGKLARMLARMRDKQSGPPNHIHVDRPTIGLHREWHRSQTSQRGMRPTGQSILSCVHSKQEWGSGTMTDEDSKTTGSLTDSSYDPISKPRHACLRGLEDWDYQRQLFEGS